MNKQFKTVIGTTLDSHYNSLLDIITSVEEEEFTVSDITVCVAIRLTQLNPWVLMRLEFMLSYYMPSPQFLIIDFGSEYKFKKDIEDLCKKNNAKYIYVDDTGVFSAAKARNIGALNVNSKFIFFSDIDLVFKSNIFENITSLINSLNISIAPRRCIFLPVYNLTKESTNRFFEVKSNNLKDAYLDRLSYENIGSAFGEYFSFIAPYSNAYLITKEFFILSGGYCDLFRGHGSEDFEYLIRLGILSTNIPIPESLNKDFYGPLKDSFWESQLEYNGFRKYLEALTIPSELQGLKAFHLYHISPSEKGYWTANNDWKRNNFNKIIGSYYKNMENILLQDYIDRPKKALCIFSDKNQWGYFLPIRLYGYKLDIICDGNDENIYNVLNRIEKKQYDRIFIFNPYMKSHTKFRSIIECSRSIGIKVTIIERGGLPNSLYYDDEVAYGNSLYHNIDSIISTYIAKTPNKTKSLIYKIRSGTVFLERQEDYKVTHSKFTILRNCNLYTVFIPLQLEDDMAVTKFTDGYPLYTEFIDQIKSAIHSNPDIIFVIKPHPLSKKDISFIQCDNVKIIDRNDNIHAIIDSCNFTITYNSGVGLLSCIHQVPTFNIGNSYYSSINTLSNKCLSIDDAILRFKKKEYHITLEKDLILFIDWLINEKYSWFSATDLIRDFDNRKSHAYKDIIIEQINLDGIKKNVGSLRNNISRKSYLNHRITIFPIKSIDNKCKTYQRDNKCNMLKKMKKLITNPYNFCIDSKNNLIRTAHIFFKNQNVRKLK